MAVSGSGSKTLTYDANGNLTSDGTRTFEWDPLNRLTAVTSGTHRSEFTYNGLSQRVKIVEKDNGAVTSTKQFVWVPGAAQPSEERDGSNNVTKRFYPQGEQIGSASYYYTKDHLGSVREMTDGSGAVQTRYDYDPYGRRTKLSGSLDADFGFTGHYYHQPSGLDLTKNRAYDADLGRWLSRDPIGEDGGINIYGYVLGNPIRFIDLFALDRLVGFYAGNPIIIKDNPAPGQNPFGGHYIDPMTNALNDTDVSIGMSASAGGLDLFDARLSLGLSHYPTFKCKTFDNFNSDLGTGISLDLHIDDRYDESTSDVGAEIGEHLGFGIGIDDNGIPTEYSLKLGIGIGLPIGYGRQLR